MSINNQEQPTRSWASYPAPGTSTDPHAPDRPVPSPGPGNRPQAGGHKWMMLLMCVPLVAFGIWQFVAGGDLRGLIAGVMCFAMMAVMHLSMGGSHKH